MLKWVVGSIIGSILVVLFSMGLSSNTLGTLAQMVFFLFVIPLGASVFVNALRDRGPTV